MTKTKSQRKRSVLRLRKELDSMFHEENKNQWIKRAKPTYIGGGLTKIDRKQRAELKFKQKLHICKTLPRDLGNANMQVVAMLMTNPSNQPFEHLTFRRLWEK